MEEEEEEEGATAGLQAIEATQGMFLSLLLPLKVAPTLLRHMCYIHNLYMLYMYIYIYIYFIYMLYILISTISWNTPLPVGAL